MNSTSKFVLKVGLPLLLLAMFYFKNNIRGYYALYTIPASQGYQKRLNSFKSEMELTKTVLFGNSITQRFPKGCLEKLSIANRGISGEMCRTGINRLEELSRFKPDTVYFFLGINDLLVGFSAQSTLKCYKNLLFSIRQKLPKSTFVVLSILPVSFEEGTFVEPIRTNKKIMTLNEYLGNMCESEKKMEFLNIYSEFELSGVLNPDLSTDGVHLNDAGYSLLCDLFAKNRKKGLLN